MLPKENNGGSYKASSCNNRYLYRNYIWITGFFVLQLGELFALLFYSYICYSIADYAN